MTNLQGFLDRFALDVDPSWLSVPVGLLAMGAVLLYAPLSGDAATMLAITVLCISLWVGAPVAPWFTGVVCLGLVGATFSTDLALVGFRSPATWLVVFGILLGEATRRSGLAKLVERRVLRATPARVTGDAVAVYRYMLLALSLAGLVMVVLVPSSLVRVLILGPILISVGEVFDERRPRVGLFLGPLFVTYYAGSGVLTGSLGNIIITGLVESNAGVSIGWVQWFVWLAPVMWIGRAIAVVAIAYALYRPRNATALGTTDVDADRTVSTDARRMLAFLLVGVAIWATDSVHGLHPLYGALAVTLLAFAPRIGVVGPDAVSDANFSIIFFLGAIFAVAEGLRQTGFTDLAARAVLSSLPRDASLVVVLAFVVVTAIALTFLMEGLAVASVLTPVLVSFTASAGVPLVPVAMTEAIALNTYFFPYQSAVLVGILGLGMVDARELVKMAAACSLATLLVLLPIQILAFAAAF
ncbi:MULTISPECIES: SLC13 family permease [Halorussus]|uniref:SLC13 family permease n=1 Tax=Halorussus TaxID=1070314 RepID=UPI0020A1675E|nr:SLC13 family permease [Halorussus vallis]USZ77815.1 SLC13 family permease [Halorussus vallis]